MNKTYIVLLSSDYLRDTQVLSPDDFPLGFDLSDEDAVWEYACEPSHHCWEDYAGSIFVDIVKAKSETEAIKYIADKRGLHEMLLSAICVDDIS